MFLRFKARNVAFDSNRRKLSALCLVCLKFCNCWPLSMKNVINYLHDHSKCEFSKKIKDKSSVFSTFGAAAILILKSETTFTVILLHTNKHRSELALGFTASPPHVLED